MAGLRSPLAVYVDRTGLTIKYAACDLPPPSTASSCWGCTDSFTSSTDSGFQSNIACHSLDSDMVICPPFEVCALSAGCSCQIEPDCRSSSASVRISTHERPSAAPISGQRTRGSRLASFHGTGAHSPRLRDLALSWRKIGGPIRDRQMLVATRELKVFLAQSQDFDAIGVENMYILCIPSQS